MRTYRLRRGRVLLEVAGALFFASGSAALAIVRHRPYLFFVPVVLVAGALWLATKLAKSGPALAYDEKGIRIAAFGRPLEIAWNRVKRIYVQQLETEGRRGYGFSADERWDRFSNVDIVRHKFSIGQGLFKFSPGFRRDHLIVEYVAAGGARSVRIDGNTMTLPEAGVVELAADLLAAQQSILGDRNAAYARLGLERAEARPQRVTGVQAERFARIGLATANAEDRAEEHTHAPSAPRPSFGRRGLQ